MMGSCQMLLMGALFAVTNIFGSPQICLLFIGNLIAITRSKETLHAQGACPELGKVCPEEYYFEVAASFRILAHPSISSLFQYSHEHQQYKMPAIND